MTGRPSQPAYNKLPTTKDYKLTKNHKTSNERIQAGEKRGAHTIKNQNNSCATESLRLAARSAKIKSRKQRSPNPRSMSTEFTGLRAQRARQGLSTRLFYLIITRLHRVTWQPEHEARGAGRCMD